MIRRGTEARRHGGTKGWRERGLVAIAALGALIGAVELRAQEPAQNDVEPVMRDTLDRISPESLRGHLSFIASDLLEGRDTPSRGLDIAAEYIAAQFRRAGLEPAGDDGYFQTAQLLVERRTEAEFAVRLTVEGEDLVVPPDRVSLLLDHPADLKDAPLFRIDLDDRETLEGLGAEDLEGAVVLSDLPDFRSPDGASRERMMQGFGFMQKVAERGAAMILVRDDQTPRGTGLGRGRIVEGGRRGWGPQLPVLRLHGERLVDRLGRLPGGRTGATVTAAMPAPEPENATVRNVVGRLPGADPGLQDTAVVVSAHYDHIGVGAAVAGDNIFNGANDDGSGTVSVIELASAFGAMDVRPRRSIVFVTFFGEERGLLGSRHYVENPVVPLDRTVANLNLEHVGRTDDQEEPRERRLMLTGHGYSSVTDIVQAAADASGMELHHHPRNCDMFFGRSDNVAFAQAGVPAHTLCTAFIFPEYHGRGDHWDLVDYDNMAAASRTVAIALWRLANAEDLPRWTRGHPRTGRYVEAWEELHGDSAEE